MRHEQSDRMTYFYRTPHKRQNWQQVSIGHQLLPPTRNSSKGRETSLADAQHYGYVFEPAQPPTAAHGWLAGFRFRDI